MIETRELLIEIGAEELPPHSLLALSMAFADGVATGLRQRTLAFTTIERFATPRRLALRVHELATAQADRELVRRGPALRAAFDAHGQPTQAALGFAHAGGVALADLEREETEKGAWLIQRQRIPGAATATLLNAVIAGALASLPIAKRMRWGSSDVEFVRPVHWAVLLFGEQLIDAEILGVCTASQTWGHRFHHPAPLTILHPADYADLLRTAGYVEPVFELRRQRILEGVERIAADQQAHAIIDPDCLDEVTALTEWPVPLLGTFDAAFLTVPAEALIETMQKNQKYFPLVDNSGQLLPRFIAISNLESRDPIQVQAGNERVIRPRFKDAMFFWEQDLKQPLQSRMDALNQVVFQQQLGSLAAKSRRLVRLSEWMAMQIGLDPVLAARSAYLCKCDLLTHMVGEFGNLQGIMGRYYATAHGESAEVATAIAAHYQPRYAGDALPSTPYGQVLALADRLDSLVGIFALGQKPSGVKDPYGLRRAALGVLRIMIETPLALDLQTLLEVTAGGFIETLPTQAAASEVLVYCLERLPGYYSERGIRGDIVEAVLARQARVLSDIDQRIHALTAFRVLPEAASLAAAHKRIRNILKKTAVPIADFVQPECLQETSEIQLYAMLEKLRPEVNAQFQHGAYAAGLQQLAQLKVPVDAFFEQVMVLHEQAAIRNNRLALLVSLETLLSAVGDLACLQ